MAGKIFINYRRDDSAAWAGRVYERLSRDFKKNQLFMDVDHIEPGLDFVAVLDEQVAACDVFLCVIGRHWIGSLNEAGLRRLEDPDDFVRIEIESALKRNIRVVPVLVDGARMPKVDELPEALKPLVRRNAIELTHGRFGSDVQGLVETLQKVVGGKPAGASWFAGPLAAKVAQSPQSRARQALDAVPGVSEVQAAPKMAPISASSRLAETVFALGAPVALIVMTTVGFGTLTAPAKDAAPELIAQFKNTKSFFSLMALLPIGLSAFYLMGRERQRLATGYWFGAAISVAIAFGIVFEIQGWFSSGRKFAFFEALGAGLIFGSIVMSCTAIGLALKRGAGLTATESAVLWLGCILPFQLAAPVFWDTGTGVLLSIVVSALTLTLVIWKVRMTVDPLASAMLWTGSILPLLFGVAWLASTIGLNVFGGTEENFATRRDATAGMLGTLSVGASALYLGYRFWPQMTVSSALIYWLGSALILSVGLAFSLHSADILPPAYGTLAGLVVAVLGGLVLRAFGQLPATPAPRQASP